jgi:prevent-host-death family protein
VRTLRLRDAKVTLSAVVEAGEATTITKHGRPAAIVVPVDDARRLYATERPALQIC